MKTQRPIVCTCLNQGLQAIVLKSDYDAASQEYWERIEAGIEEVVSNTPAQAKSGKLIPVPHNKVFVFDILSDELTDIARRCWFQEAPFMIPFPGQWECPEPQLEAWAAKSHLFGETPDFEPVSLAEAFEHLCSKDGHKIRLILKESFGAAEATRFFDSHGEAFVTQPGRDKLLRIVTGKQPYPCDRGIILESKGSQNLASLATWLAPYVEHITLLADYSEWQNMKQFVKILRRASVPS